MAGLRLAETGLGMQAAIVSATTPLARLVAATRSITAEPVMQRMLRVASRELTHMLSAEACLISKLDEDGLLREVADYSASSQQIARGVTYYVADYPLTADVLASGVSRSVSSEDPAADPAELFVLREVGMEAVLLVPLSVESHTWGLIEVYDTRARPFSGRRAAPGDEQ